MAVLIGSVKIRSHWPNTRSLVTITVRAIACLPASDRAIERRALRETAIVLRRSGPAQKRSSFRESLAAA